MKKTTSSLFKIARLLIDFKVLFSGKPSKIVKRAANKWIGRNIVSKLWIK